LLAIPFTLQDVLREPWAVAVQDTIKRGAQKTVRGGRDPFYGKSV